METFCSPMLFWTQDEIKCKEQIDLETSNQKTKCPSYLNNSPWKQKETTEAVNCLLTAPCFLQSHLHRLTAPCFLRSHLHSCLHGMKCTCPEVIIQSVHCFSRRFAAIVHAVKLVHAPCGCLATLVHSQLLPVINQLNLTRTVFQIIHVSVNSKHTAGW